MNKKTIYIIVAVLVVVIVVAAAGVILLNNNDGNEGTDNQPTTTPTPVADATSIQFTVTSEDGTYLYSAKNIGDNTVLAIEYIDESHGFTTIIDGEHQMAADNMSGTWVEQDFQETKSDWQPMFETYLHDLSGWTSGDWTDGSTTISNIKVNPTLDDSIFDIPTA